MSRGDQLELEAAKLAAEVLKTTAAVAVAFVAALSAYLKSAGLVVEPLDFLVAFGPCIVATGLAALSLLFSVKLMSEGRSPLENVKFVALLVMSPLSLVVGLFSGLAFFLGPT